MRAHGLYWAIMLHALGFPDEQMPKFLVHGWWNISGAKMSKSLGNVVDPDALADKYGAEALRYYLMGDIVTGKDSDFSEERLLVCQTGELANTIGNLLHRTLNMVQKYGGGIIRKISARSLPDGVGTLNLQTLAEIEVPNAVRDYSTRMDGFRPDAGFSDAATFAVFCNVQIVETTPWKLAKHTEEKAQLD